MPQSTNLHTFVGCQVFDLGGGELAEIAKAFDAESTLDFIPGHGSIPMCSSECRPYTDSSGLGTLATSPRPA